MVLGLTAVVRDDSSSFVQKTLVSPCIIFQPVELLFGEFIEKNERNSAYGPDLIRARIEYEKILRNTVQKGVKPLFIFDGIPDENVGRIFSLIVFRNRS